MRGSLQSLSHLLPERPGELESSLQLTMFFTKQPKQNDIVSDRVGVSEFSYNHVISNCLEQKVPEITKNQ